MSEWDQWNNPRGYAIHPGPLCRLTNLDAKRTERNVEWAKSHLGVSRRKDSEGRSSSAWNMNLPGKPAVDYGKVRFLRYRLVVKELKVNRRPDWA
jgi:primary-amine oxidase